MEEKRQKLNGLVYKARNRITGESYIGITTHSIKQRKLDHIERALRGESGKFYEAIATYGEDAFYWEQIDTAYTQDELAAKEREYILEYSTIDDGYNSDSGGGIKKTIFQYDLLTKKLISEYDCLKSAASAVNATKQDISRACLGANGKLRGFLWSYQDSEIFNANGDSRKKVVAQLDMEGLIMAEYISVTEASRKTGLSKTCISRVCRGERESSGGYIWKYL